MIIKFVMNFFRCLLRFGVNDDFNGLAVNRGNSIKNNIEGNKTFIGTIGFGVFFLLCRVRCKNLKAERFFRA